MLHVVANKAPFNPPIRYPMKVAVVRMYLAALCAFCLIFSHSSPAHSGNGDDRSLRELLHAQVKKYPLMQIQDVYKLLYQSAFGNAHLLRDPKSAQKYLSRELEEVEARDMPLLESISPDSSLVRVSLCAFRFRRLNKNLLFEAMLQSAGRTRGDPELFRKRWRGFVNMVEQQKLPFKPEAVKAFEEKHLSDPHEMHHSKNYQKAYSPHYRVVRREVFTMLFPGIAP
ncbi:MAG: hypothetical protein V2A78_02830 [bacterium]